MPEHEPLGPIPGLEIREKIGGGGMGTVYKAYQPALDRVVALKTVRPEYLSGPGLSLFQREARLLARCHHPNIVQILEFRPEHAVPYFLMEYVDGIPLDQALRGRPWKELALLFKEVAATVAFAHAHGVVHGDLKPANVLVDRQSRPHVLDFGLARLARDAADGDSPSGGTPGYAAPEVWDGRSPPTTLSDIYALGVTLYALLTGVLPYRSRKEAREGQARLPIEHDADIPEPLQRICLKAMEPDPEGRYQSAEHLRRDLERFGGGEPVLVRPTRYHQELQGRVRNHMTEVQAWEREGLISRRERDALVRPYQGLLAADSPWLSELRAVLTGPLLIRVGAWCLLLSSLLWLVFYWGDLGRPARLGSAGVPALLMGALGAGYLIAGNRRNALACLGSFVLQLLVLEAVLLAEFRWLEYRQPPDWELWGRRLDRAPPGPAEVDAGPPAEEPDEMREKPRGLPRVGRQPPGEEGPASESEARLRRLLRGHGQFMLSNSQLFAAALTITLCVALLMGLLRARFFAPWLAATCLGLIGTGLLLVGDKERLLHDRGSWVAVHWLGFAPALYLLACVLERRAAAPVARPFYRIAGGVGLTAAVALAYFGTEEWFGHTWDVDEEVWNLWLMAYSLPFLVLAWLIERYGTEGQRPLAARLYLLVPLFLLLPLNLLFGQGPEVFGGACGPFRLYELLGLAACAALLVLGRCLHVQAFLLAGLWGLTVWLFRVTFDHFDGAVRWPLAVALGGGLLVALGVWVSRRSGPAPEDYRRPPKAPADGGTPGPAQPETVPLPR
jgi:hypothetical protein